MYTKIARLASAALARMDKERGRDLEDATRIYKYLIDVPTKKRTR